MKYKKSRKGITLMELIIVLAIMAIIAGIAVFGYKIYINNAKDKAAILDCRTCVKTYNLIKEENESDGKSKEPINGEQVAATARVKGMVTNILTTDDELTHLTYTNDSRTVYYCSKGKCSECFNTTEYMLDSQVNEGLYYAGGETPSTTITSGIEKILEAYRKDPSVQSYSSIDSTALEGAIIGNNKIAYNTGKFTPYFNFTGTNIKTWAIRRDGGKQTFWWSDQDITKYKAGDQIRVIKYNSELKTYTAGYMKIVQLGDGDIKYNALAGKDNNSTWKEYSTADVKQTDETKQSYEISVKIYNSMDPYKN